MLWKSGAPRMEPFHHRSYTMPLETPGLPSRAKRFFMASPISFRLVTISGSRFGLTGFSNGGTQIRPGKGPL